MKKYWAIYKKHEEIINYLIVGFMTMFVSLIFYFISTRTFLDPNNAFQLQIANLIKWVSGVLFAYVTNRIFVFKSKSCYKVENAHFCNHQPHYKHIKKQCCNTG